MKIFVSHADPDKMIALPFSGMLKSGIGLHEVFCSSTKGAIKNGNFFVQEILTELNNADCVISLLTPNY